MAEIYPGCLGYYGAPLPPNGPCRKCRYAEICKHVAANFIPKAKLQPILERLISLENTIRG